MNEDTNGGEVGRVTHILRTREKNVNIHTGIHWGPAMEGRKLWSSLGSPRRKLPLEIPSEKHVLPTPTHHHPIPRTKAQRGFKNQKPIAESYLGRHHYQHSRHYFNGWQTTCINLYYCVTPESYQALIRAYWAARCPLVAAAVQRGPGSVLW